MYEERAIADDDLSTKPNAISAADALLLALGAVATAALLAVGHCVHTAATAVSSAAVPSTSSLHTSQLLQLSRTEDVCLELLHRDGLDAKTRMACLLRLAVLRQQSAPDVLKTLILSVPQGAPTALQHNLCGLASELSPADAERLVIRLRDADRKTPTSAALTVSVAILLTINRTDEDVRLATSSQKLIRDQFLQSVTLLPTASARRRVYRALRGLLLSADSDQKTEHRQEGSVADGLKNVMAALCRVSVDERTKTADLVRLADNPHLRKQAMDALANIPPEFWPPDELGHIAAHCVGIIAGIDADERTSDESASVLRVVQLARQRMSGHKATRLTSRLHQLLPPANRRFAVASPNAIQNAENTGGAKNQERTGEYK